jgi:hypothetical protein
MQAAALATAVLCLGLGILTALRSEVVYSPVAKVVLFMLVGLVPAIIFSSHAAAHLELSGPGFAVTAGGAVATSFIAFLLLNHFSEPEVRLAVYRVVGENGASVTLEGDDQVRIFETGQSAGVRSCVDRDMLFLLFPEQVQDATLQVRFPPSDASAYEASIGYAGVRRYTLQLGKELVKR